MSSFCGRQAAGGHDIVAGLYDAMSDDSTLYGFVGGSRGLCHGDAQILDADVIASYRGLGGYELLGRSSDSISAKDFEKVLKVCTDLHLDGLVLVGGARTATDTMYLSEFMLQKNCETVVVCVPADMGGSMRNQFVETTVGFDTSTKASAQIVGNKLCIFLLLFLIIKSLILFLIILIREQRN